MHSPISAHDVQQIEQLRVAHKLLKLSVSAKSTLWLKCNYHEIKTTCFKVRETKWLYHKNVSAKNLWELQRVSASMLLHHLCFYLCYLSSTFGIRSPPPPPPPAAKCRPLLNTYNHVRANLTGAAQTHRGTGKRADWVWKNLRIAGKQGQQSSN